MSHFTLTRPFFYNTVSSCVEVDSVARFPSKPTGCMRFQVCVHVCGLLEVSLWLLVAVFFLSILATTVWYLPFKLLPTWNCIIMRNQEVIEQPMKVETLPQRLLAEAQNFIKR